jgi:hypothetical protein
MCVGVCVGVSEACVVVSELGLLVLDLGLSKKNCSELLRHHLTTDDNVVKRFGPNL